MAAIQQSSRLSLGAELVSVAEEESGRRPIGGLVAADGPEPLSTSLAQVVALLGGQDPVDGDVRLYDHVDPEALDALFAHAATHDDATWRFELDVGSENLAVGSDGTIELVR